MEVDINHPCKNPECKEIVSVFGQDYCSRECYKSHILKDIKKEKKKKSSRFLRSYIEWQEEGKKCLECLQPLKHSKKYQRHFCCQSCAATYNNRIRKCSPRQFSEEGKQNIREALQRRFSEIRRKKLERELNPELHKKTKDELNVEKLISLMRKKSKDSS